VFVVAGCGELVVALALWRLLVVHRDLVRGAFAGPGRAPVNASPERPG
jgi:hypothetical protein